MHVHSMGLFALDLFCFVARIQKVSFWYGQIPLAPWIATSICISINWLERQEQTVLRRKTVGKISGMVGVLIWLCTFAVFSRIHGSNKANELFYRDDPSIDNPNRPPVKDDRAGAFNMTAREALKAIEEVHNGTVDCETMLTERSLKLLYFKYENSVYTAQANLAIRTANLISDLLPTGSAKTLNISDKLVLKTHREVLHAIVRNNLENDQVIVGSAIIFDNNSFIDNSFFAPYAYRNVNDTFIKVTDLSSGWSYLHEAFVRLMKFKSRGRPFPTRTTYFNKQNDLSSASTQLKLTHKFVESKDGLWSRPYFECRTVRAWLITYTSPILGSWDPNGSISFMGMTTIDIALTNVDINQCDKESGGKFQFEIFAGTHRCKNRTTQCEPVTGLGFRAGSYKCVCRSGYYFPNVTASAKYFNGSEIEAATVDPSHSYYSNPDSFQCIMCQPGCEACVDDSPCIVTLNWPLRRALLGLTVVTILVAIGISAFILYFRELKVVKTASPHFLVIILAGCMLSYCEILVLYPEPQNTFCIVRLWFRHIGFGLGFTSLLLKTWRIAVIFRVKSAQKIKLTDRHLIQRLAPILALYIVYLLAWSLAGPSHVVEMKMPGELKFHECSFDWWDHAILIFEILFLFWGIHLCYNVRKAPSAFNESKFISWSIYNLTVVTFFLKITRLFIGDLAGPDMIYLLEFFRVQLAVSVLVGLVFVPKIIRVIKGRGDVFDTSGRIASVKGAALNMAAGQSSEGTVNLSQENEDLKEEIRKLYGQLQQMKTANMEAGNRHLGRSSSLLFGGSTPSLLSSTPNNNGSMACLTTSAREKRPQRYSPAAELASDFV